MLLVIYVLYPNNIKKQYNKQINYANRGMDLEDLINKTNEYNISINKALIYKKPTPIGVVDVSYSKEGKKIEKAYFKEQSTLDYNGLYKGKYIEFEAKETTSKTSIPLKNFHAHQIKHIRMVIEHKGIVFIIIKINGLIYLLKGNDFIDYIDTHERKSVEYDYIKNKGFLLKENYLKGLNYLDVVDEVFIGG